MNIKQNDRVKVDGREAVVQSWWGAGKHLMFQLDDGRVVADLDKLVASGAATIESKPNVLPPKSKWLPRDSLPLEDVDE